MLARFPQGEPQHSNPQHIKTLVQKTRELPAEELWVRAVQPTPLSVLHSSCLTCELLRLKPPGPSAIWRLLPPLLVLEKEDRDTVRGSLPFSLIFLLVLPTRKTLGRSSPLCFSQALAQLVL